MPTYEYRCPEGHEFERFYRKISDATSEVACPECGKIAERQLSAGAGLLFKGSGFYLTDYGKNAHRKSGGEKSGGESKGDSGSSSGGDSSGGETKKPETKSEPKPAESKPADKPAPKKAE